jgi:hypothetical protein
MELLQKLANRLQKEDGQQLQELLEYLVDADQDDLRKILEFITFGGLAEW